MDILKKIEFLIPIFSCMPAWLKAVTIVWLILGVIILCFTVPNFYKKNLTQYVNTQKRDAINVVRFYEDFDLWLTKTLDSNEKKLHEIDGNFNSRGVLQSGMYLVAQFERVKDCQSKINEQWLKNVERPLQDFLLKEGAHSIDDIVWLNKEDKEKLITIDHKKEEAVKDVKDSTVAKLKRMSFDENMINGAMNKVLGK